MKQVLPVEGDSLQEYVQKYNEAQAELSRFTILGEEKVDSLSRLIYYETPEEVDRIVDKPAGPESDYIINFEDSDPATEVIRIELKVPENKNRRCCECDNYNWGIGCPFRDGHIKLMDNACEMFNIIIERRP